MEENVTDNSKRYDVIKLIKYLSRVVSILGNVDKEGVCAGRDMFDVLPYPFCRGVLLHQRILDVLKQ